MEWRRGKRAVERSAEAVNGMTAANRRGKLYHLLGCPEYRQVSAKNQALFTYREAVEAEGFLLARNCRRASGTTWRKQAGEATA